ncbi:MAG: HAD hydrolase family protein [Clostridiales bacterium]|nr:HAD hydrolase family protein [Clostridiales bacterium]
MKTLYLSDLDGTLLNSNQRISEFSVKVINAVIERGAIFSVATARSEETARRVFSKRNFVYNARIRKAHNKSQPAFLIHLS